jgi:hypothetical protein
MTIPDKWFQPIRKFVDLIVGPTDLTVAPNTFQKIPLNKIRYKTLVAPPISPKITG